MAKTNGVAECTAIIGEQCVQLTEAYKSLYDYSLQLESELKKLSQRKVATQSWWKDSELWWRLCDGEKYLEVSDRELKSKVGHATGEHVDTLRAWSALKYFEIALTGQTLTPSQGE